MASSGVWENIIYIYIIIIFSHTPDEAMSGGLAKACVPRKNYSVPEKIEFLYDLMFPMSLFLSPSSLAPLALLLSLIPWGSVVPFYSGCFLVEPWDSLSDYVYPGIACLAFQACDWVGAFWGSLSAFLISHPFVRCPSKHDPC